MGYEIEVTARATRTSRRILSDYVGESGNHSNGDTLVPSVVDQAALVSVITRSNGRGGKQSVSNRA